MTGRSILAMEIEEQARQILHIHLPESEAFQLSCQGWFTRGVVTISWVDGSALTEVASLLAPLRGEHGVHIDLQRRVSYAFLGTVVEGYCRVANWVPPRVEQRSDGTASLDPFCPRMLLEPITEQINQLNARDVPTLVYRFDQRLQQVVRLHGAFRALVRYSKPG